ncbi:tetratricopeptide repeat protein [Aquimarina sp. 2201CG1-2-11]|uniref:tetratricopeptide repeat protein n=1 Tax=Aquimarina discodermiae TaxID=3231043 RepID=UPI003462E0B7
MKSYYLIIIYTVFLNCNLTLAQSNSDESGRVAFYLKRSKGLQQKKLDSSFFYVEKALAISKSIKNDTLIAKSYLQKSSLFILKKNFPKADSLLQLNLRQELPKHIEGQTLHNLATIQYYKQDFKKALDIYIQAAKVLEQSKSPKQLVNTYANIGAINAALKNFKNALIYLERALPLSKSNEVLRLQILVNLCNIYLDQKLHKKFTDNIFDLEKLALKYKSTRVLSVVYNNLSNYYTDKGSNYDLAVTYGKKAIVLKKELNQSHTLNLTYNNVAYSFLKKGEYKNAIVYLDSALIGAKGVLKSYIYNNYKEAHFGLKNYEIALQYADLKDIHKDSLTNSLQKEKVAELTEKFESEKKQNQINILDTKNELQALTIKQQNYLLITILIFGVLILVLGYFGFKNYKTKEKLDKILLQQRLKKAQLNPHFLFNALQSIQNFIRKNDQSKSSSYLSSYSKLIRLILEKSDEDFISVEDDKIALESYLKLQQINQTHKFSYDLFVEETVDEDFDLIPTLATQPFVENAIIHGVKDNKNGIISIRYYKENNTLFVAIKDNGNGYTVLKDNSKRLHKSMSTDIIREQFKNLNKTSNNFEGAINTRSSTEGTEVTLSFTRT